LKLQGLKRPELAARLQIAVSMVNRRYQAALKELGRKLGA